MKAVYVTKGIDAGLIVRTCDPLDGRLWLSACVGAVAESEEVRLLVPWIENDLLMLKDYPLSAWCGAQYFTPVAEGITASAVGPAPRRSSDSESRSFLLGSWTW